MGLGLIELGLGFIVLGLGFLLLGLGFIVLGFGFRGSGRLHTSSLQVVFAFNSLNLGELYACRRERVHVNQDWVSRLIIGISRVIVGLIGVIWHVKQVP